MKMSKKISCPEGLLDILPKECKQRESVMNLVKEHLELCGYKPIQTPVLEHYEVFCNGKKFQDNKLLCKFIDMNGNILALRPDITVAAARLAALNLLPSEKPLKLYYSGNVYRVDRQHSNISELMQIGGEIFGDEGFLSDVESMVNACEALKRAGLNSFRLDIGCTQITKIAVSKLEISNSEKDRLLALIENKTFVEIEYFLSEVKVDQSIKDIIRAVPKLFGKANMIIKELEKWLTAEEYLPYIERLKNICSILNEMGYEDCLYIDIAMPSLMGYYTGVTFCGYSPRAGSPIFSGGRYDRLFDEFGIKEPAVGFAIYIDTLMRVLEGHNGQKENIETIYYTEDSYSGCYRSAMMLRNKGITVSLLPSQREEEKC
jgi:ATP phosphoribosyltransferase regulatory subunit